MDVAAVLGWLALAVVLNTFVTALLAVLIVRSGMGSGRADPGRPAMLGKAAPGPAASAGEDDPLAGAISAFLGRSDGLFRAGGPSPGQRVGSAGPRRQAVPGLRSTAPMPPATAAAASPLPPETRQPVVSAHDRPLSEVTWATSRPSRFVPSGPRPPEPGVAPDPIGQEARSDAPPMAPVGLPVSRVSIAVADRDGSGAGAGPAAVARLGPVIGGLIRERTRAGDRISGLTGGRYSLILPDTSLDGAAALSRRLAQSCDAWLAAEQPPLRLEFGWVDLPTDLRSEGPVTVRLSGPERRRTVAQDA
ncbi:MAG: hypothetical protein M3P84_10475 [Chloroflexota bacterium]|nr:hypothetical protein [Chloroflexota bacterium]